jgi:hypothetical protein
MCPTNQLVKQQEESQSKPQVEQVKINHGDGGDLKKKMKKRRRCV